MEEGEDVAAAAAMLDEQQEQQQGAQQQQQEEEDAVAVDASAGDGDGNGNGGGHPPAPAAAAPAPAPAAAAPIFKLKVKPPPPPPPTGNPILPSPTAAATAVATVAFNPPPFGSFAPLAAASFAGLAGGGVGVGGAQSTLSAAAGGGGGGAAAGDGAGGLKLRLPKPPPPPPSDGSMKLKLRRPPPPPPPKRGKGGGDGKAKAGGKPKKKEGLDAWLSSSSESEGDDSEEDEEAAEAAAGEAARAAARDAARQEEDEWQRKPFPTTKFDRLVAFQRRRFPSVTDAEPQPATEAEDEVARRRAGLGKKAWAKHKAALDEAGARARAAVRIVGEGEGDEAATAEAVLEVVRLRGLHPTLVRGTGQGLGITVPDPGSFSVRDVARVVGPEAPVPVMDVERQVERADGWTLGKWAEYFHGDRLAQKQEGLPVLNVISLEFSASPLAAMVQAPAFVRAVDWIDTVWPADKKAQDDYPKVQLYCLMGVRGSYTDWHIDFGGSSVWYHVLKGAKEFFLAAPTDQNLWAYEKWVSSRQQGSTFFGDLAQGAFRLTVRAGETLLIPPGWVHAVYTPEDSLVFGGNFLHGFHTKTQIAIAQLERRTHVGPESRFPHFERMLLYALAHYTQKLRDPGTAGGVSEMERQGLPALCDYCERVLPDHLAEAEEVARAQEPPTTPTGLLEAMRAVLKAHGLQGALSLAATRAKRAPKRRELDFGSPQDEADDAQRRKRAKAGKKRPRATAEGKEQAPRPPRPRPIRMLDGSDSDSGSDSEEEGAQESLFGRRRRPAHLRDYEVYAGADASSEDDEAALRGDEDYSDTEDHGADAEGGGGWKRGWQRPQAFVRDEDEGEEDGEEAEEEGEGEEEEGWEGAGKKKPQQPHALSRQASGALELIQKRESGQLPPDHPALLSKTYSLSTLPAAAPAVPGGKPLGSGVVGQQGAAVAGAVVTGAVKKKERDKKTIARIKKLIKYKK